MAVLVDEYLWLVVVGAFVAFGFGWGTGANDVANAFGTSVGSKTLTLRQAVLIASVFEFPGALLLGRVSTNTIASGIAKIGSFSEAPNVYSYGMVCALIVGTVWLILTSYWGFNVSSTHSIIGGIIGFALVWDGLDAVLWAKKDTQSFPPYKGVIAIVMSWFIAPILTGAAAALIFWSVRTLVLRRKYALHTQQQLGTFVVVELSTLFVCLIQMLTHIHKTCIYGPVLESMLRHNLSLWSLHYGLKEELHHTCRIQYQPEIESDSDVCYYYRWHQHCRLL